MTAGPRQSVTTGRVALGDQRQHAVPDEIAIEAGVGVAVVINPLQLACGGGSTDLGTRHVK